MFNYISNHSESKLTTCKFFTITPTLASNVTSFPLSYMVIIKIQFRCKLFSSKLFYFSSIIFTGKSRYYLIIYRSRIKSDAIIKVTIKCLYSNVEKAGTEGRSLELVLSTNISGSNILIVAGLVLFGFDK